MKILGIDSGLERTGYAVFNKRENDYKLVDYGCIFTSREEVLARRLIDLQKQSEKIIEKFKPKVFVIEKLFFGINKKTIIKIAQSQGVLLALAGKYDAGVEFLTPLVIKSALTGYGRADKMQVQKMVKILLKLDEIPKPDDVADAIACGLAYCTIKKFE